MSNIDLGYFFLFFLTFTSYFLFRFGMISRGNLNYVIEFVGGSLLLLSFILMLLLHGWKNIGIQVLVFWFVITPLGEFLLTKLDNKLYGVYKSPEFLRFLNDHMNEPDLKHSKNTIFEGKK